MAYVDKSDRISVYQWKGVDILIMRMPDGGNAPEHYRVMGGITSETMEGAYKTVPLLKKEQRHCRAYLRGVKPAKSWQKISSRAKISFLENL